MTVACIAMAQEAGFEVASVRPAAACEGRAGPRFGVGVSPGRLSVTCQTVDFLIRQAYLGNGRDPLFVQDPLYDQPIQGSPVWLTTNSYTIEAMARVPSVRRRQSRPAAE